MKFITLIHSIHVPAPDLNFKFLIHWRKKKQSAFLSPTSSIVSQKPLKYIRPSKIQSLREIWKLYTLFQISIKLVYRSTQLLTVSYRNNCPSLKNLKKQLNNCNLIKTFYQHYNVQFQWQGTYTISVMFYNV